VTLPQWNPATQYFQPVIGPDPEWLGTYFLTPILSTATIATKLPPPLDMQTTLQNFVRVEAGDSVPNMAVHGATYNVTWLAHCYDPNEVVARNNTDLLIAQAMSVGGQTLSGWYIQCVVAVVGGRRLDDPLVPANIVRYRTAVTWEVQGHAPNTIT
jgi:hypothetical protein